MIPFGQKVLEGFVKGANMVSFEKANNKKQIIKCMNSHLMILITIVIIIGGFLFSHENIINESAIQGQYPLVPDCVEDDTQKGRNYEFLLQQNKAEFCLAFYSKHISVHVYADEKLCYALEENNGIFGHSTGSRWNFVNIPGNTQKIRVETQYIYTTKKPGKLTFYKGNALDIYSSIVRQSAFAAIVSVFDVIIGIFLCIYWTFSHHRINLKKDALFFGAFAIVMGSWNFCETDLSSLFLKNRMVVSMSLYMFVMLMIIPFLCFMSSHFKLPGKAFAKGICALSVLNFYVNLALQLLDILDLRETVRQTHILMCLAVSYVLCGLVYRVWHDGWNRKMAFDLFGMALLAISFYADLNAYNSGARHADKFGYLGFFCYICLLAMEVVEESMKAIDDSRKTQIYREMALKDMLTTLYNRNAYDQWVNTHKPKEGTGVVTFDLNNLKKCNDTLGHNVGDVYIQRAAEMIQQVFGKVGRCYRIGGDEFCVIIERAKEAFLKSKFQELEHLQDAYNRTEEEIPMQIAHGYAIYHDSIDVDIESTRNRADAIMYQNKKRLKQQAEAVS